MSPHSLRTADYTNADRRRLADAVAKARRAAGHRWRPSFVKEAGISLRSLEAVEAGEATVGAAVLEDIGRALGRHFRHWDADTPRRILDGAPAPSLEPMTLAKLDIRWIAQEEFVALLEAEVEDVTLERRLEHWRGRFAKEGYDEEDLRKVSDAAAKAVRAGN